MIWAIRVMLRGPWSSAASKKVMPNSTADGELRSCPAGRRAWVRSSDQRPTPQGCPPCRKPCRKRSTSWKPGPVDPGEHLGVLPVPEQELHALVEVAG